VRPLAFIALASTLALGACGPTPCESLGDRMCDCSPLGVSKQSCELGVKSTVQDLHPSSDAQDTCREMLSTCYSRQGLDFCDWIHGRCGKASCGVSEENYAALVSDGICPE